MLDATIDTRCPDYFFFTHPQLLNVSHLPTLTMGSTVVEMKISTHMARLSPTDVTPTSQCQAKPPFLAWWKIKQQVSGAQVLLFVKKIICSRPEVRNGKIISGLRPTYNYQNNMVFECNEGYILKGSKLIYCGEDGEWNPPPPTCELSKYGP